MNRKAIIGVIALAGAGYWWWMQRNAPAGGGLYGSEGYTGGGYVGGQGGGWGGDVLWDEGGGLSGGEGSGDLQGGSLDDTLFSGGGLPLVLENSGFVSDAPGWLRTKAGQIVGQYFPSLDLEMVLAICKIESSFGKNIYRAEPKINDASVGMMQTLVKTAQWLYGLGSKAFGYPTAETLKDHATSIYFGCAMLNWLSKKGGSEQDTVRAYNGGWGGRNYTSTIPYWQKYLKARGRDA